MSAWVACEGEAKAVRAFALRFVPSRASWIVLSACPPVMGSDYIRSRLVVLVSDECGCGVCGTYPPGRRCPTVHGRVPSVSAMLCVLAVETTSLAPTEQMIAISHDQI